MTKMKQILVPVDFSPMSSDAFEYAASLAEAMGACLHLLHVVEPSTLASMIFIAPMGFPLAVSGPVEAAQRHMSLMRHRCRNLPGAHVVTIGHVPDVIVDFAERHGVDYVVMATHGRQYLETLLLGSHVVEVLRRAPCPVVTVRAGAYRTEQATMKALTTAESETKGRATLKSSAG